MATVTDEREPERCPALPAQPLGFLPTRQFWRDPETQLRAGPPFMLIGFVLMFGLSLLFDPPWPIMALVFLAVVLLVQGGVERYVRRAITRERMDSECGREE
jgi:hypothetical protein